MGSWSCVHVPIVESVGRLGAHVLKRCIVEIRRLRRRRARDRQCGESPFAARLLTLPAQQVGPAGIFNSESDPHRRLSRLQRAHTHDGRGVRAFSPGAAGNQELEHSDVGAIQHRTKRIRIAARDGGRLTAEAVIARNLLRDIELFLPLVLVAGAQSGDGGLAGLAALAWFAIFMTFPFFNRDAMRAGDLVAGTFVVEAPGRRREGALDVSRAALGQEAAQGSHGYRFGEAELAVYGEYELQVLERILRDNRADAMVQVAETICAKIGWTAGRGDERAFLEAFYAQLRARLESELRFGKRKADKHAASE